jgi:hypothetical protein
VYTKLVKYVCVHLAYFFFLQYLNFKHGARISIEQRTLSSLSLKVVTNEKEEAVGDVLTIIC